MVFISCINRFITGDVVEILDIISATVFPLYKGKCVILGNICNNYCKGATFLPAFITELFRTDKIRSYVSLSASLNFFYTVAVDGPPTLSPTLVNIPKLRIKFSSSNA